MAQRRVLFVDWRSINGAAQGKRKLVLRENEHGKYTCPINICLHSDYKTARGLRKHIESRHSWFFYFDKQPEIKREEVEQLQPTIAKRASTSKKPHYSIDEGIGLDFLDWLCTSCGGGKSQREAKQIAKRAMKFLMNCTGENDADCPLSNELIDCCLGSAAIIIKFLTTIEKTWKLSSSGSLNYVKSITDLLDFRKCNGVTDSNLRCFTVTEVYLRRAKENLRKKKNLECTRNYNLETLIARDSWATLEEMEEVIPFHIERFKCIIQKCKRQTPLPSPQELSFCTRFITTFLFLRVKCSRPMTFQFLTLPMIERARQNNGFIDQTEFKTAEKYLFDTLVVTEEVFIIVDAYIDYVRPLFNPTCDYLLVSNTGSQYKSLTTAMTILVHEAIGKYVHPTRYRQIVETSSVERLTRNEQEIISEDQKHSSTVAKVFYQMKQSRNVAMQGKRCMEKMLGDTRKEKDEGIVNVLSEISALSSRMAKDPVIQQSERILQGETPSCSRSSSSSPFKSVDDSCIITSSSSDIMVRQTQNIMTPIPIDDDSVQETRDIDMEITCKGQSIQHSSSTMVAPERRSELSCSTTKLVKREKSGNKDSTGKSKFVKFSKEEDDFLKTGIQKYGLKNWASILKDKNFSFKDCRTRDSLRVRADSLAFKRHCRNPAEH
jgi:hypothetical protein